MIPLSETEIQSQIKEYLIKRNIYYRRVNVISPKKRRPQPDSKGHPDLMGFYGNKAFYIEVKKDKKSVMSDEQIDFMLACTKAKQIHVVAYSVDCVEKAFKKYKKESAL